MRRLRIISIMLILAVIIGGVVGLTLFFVLKSDARFVAFPESFKFGAASASYQIEGAWDQDGKSPNIWDTLTHRNPGFIADWTNGDVAADSYHMYQKDVAALVNIGFDSYRFSISWARILPNGTTVNMKGVEYYSNLINALIEKGIEPIVTMYHWDLPQYLQDMGGWTNPLIVDYFRVYSDVLFSHFGSRVKKWITINEPNSFCGFGYGSGAIAPAIKRPGVADYLCAHHVLLANAAAYHLYKEKYFDEYQGQVGICLSTVFFFPYNETVDSNIVDKAMQFDLGRYGHPIFIGGYPQIVIDEIGMKSRAGGYPWSRLPVMTQEQKEFIKGTADFMAVNYYFSTLVSPKKSDDEVLTSWTNDWNIEQQFDPTWKKGKSFWLHSVPEGLHALLVWIKDNYKNPVVMITENGWSDDGQIEDDDRVEYLKLHMNAVSRSIYEDDCNVVAYMVWSLVDNFEWNSGYTQKFGIHYIDFQSAERERVPKRSAQFYKDFLVSRKYEL